MRLVTPPLLLVLGRARVGQRWRGSSDGSWRGRRGLCKKTHPESTVPSFQQQVLSARSGDRTDQRLTVRPIVLDPRVGHVQTM